MKKNWAVVTGVSVVISSMCIGFSAGLAYDVAKIIEGDTDKEPREVIHEVSTIAPVRDYQTPQYEPVSTVVEDEEKDKINILLLGVDSRANDLHGRSDAIIILSIDKETGDTNMVSIPRDSYVDIIGKGKKDKINHSYAFGGIDMSKATIENLLETDIDNYAIVNFSSFVKFVDALGGIDVNVPFDFTEQDSSGKKDAISFKKGAKTLTGEEALAYSRMRHQDPEGDIGRGKRQQEVITSVVKKIVTEPSLDKYREIKKALGNGLNTDIGVKEVLQLSKYITSFDGVTQYVLEGDGMKLDNIYYYGLKDDSLEEIKTKLN